MSAQRQVTYLVCTICTQCNMQNDRMFICCKWEISQTWAETRFHMWTSYSPSCRHNRKPGKWLIYPCLSGTLLMVEGYQVSLKYVLMEVVLQYAYKMIFQLVKCAFNILPLQWGTVTHTGACLCKLSMNIFCIFQGTCKVRNVFASRHGVHRDWQCGTLPFHVCLYHRQLATLGYLLGGDDYI